MTQHLVIPSAAAVVRAEVEVVNTGPAPVVLRTVPSWSARIGGHLADWRLFTAHSDWMAENRWRTISLDEQAFPSLASELTGASPRGELRLVSTGTWSTGRRLPVGMLENQRARLAWGWQIEHNGHHNQLIERGVGPGELRRCREHCDGRRYVQHRTGQEHRCDEHDPAPCAPANPDGCDHLLSRLQAPRMPRAG